MDSALYERVIRGLNVAMGRKGLDRALAIAGRVLEDLFDGEVENFRERSRRHATYLAMLSQADCPVSRRDVWTAVRVYEQVAILPSELARGLSYTHHRLLLGVTDPEEKKALARDALRGELSKRDLEQRLGEMAPTGPPRPGRPRAPQWMKGMRQVREGIDLITDPVTLDQAFAMVDVDRLSEAARELDTQIEALTELRGRVQRRLATPKRRVAGP